MLARLAQMQRRAAEAKATARKMADDAANAVEAQIAVCEEADAALREAEEGVRRSRMKLEELNRAAQDAHVGLPRMEAGTAMRWNVDKGFGFISPHLSHLTPAGLSDLFCHASAILDGDLLQEGSTVRYVRVYDERKAKYRAEEVTGGVWPSEEEEEGDGAAAVGEGEESGTKRARDA